MTTPQLPDLLVASRMTWRWVQPVDMAFIVDSWRASAEKPFMRGEIQPFTRYGADSIRNGTQDFLRVLYSAEIRKLISNTLATGRVLVVIDEDEPSVIIGWACSEWMYVKQALRHNGIGRSLLEAMWEPSEQHYRRAATGETEAGNEGRPDQASSGAPA